MPLSAYPKITMRIARLYIVESGVAAMEHLWNESSTSYVS
jgi:hypothetical protein